MAGITLAIAQENFEAANAAYKIALNSASYSKSGGVLNRAVQHQDIEKLLKSVNMWSEEVSKLSGNSGIIISQGAPS